MELSRGAAITPAGTTEIVAAKRLLSPFQGSALYRPSTGGCVPLRGTCPRLFAQRPCRGSRPLVLRSDTLRGSGAALERDRGPGPEGRQRIAGGASPRLRRDRVRAPAGATETIAAITLLSPRAPMSHRLATGVCALCVCPPALRSLRRGYLL